MGRTAKRRAKKKAKRRASQGGSWGLAKFAEEMMRSMKKKRRR